MNIKLSLTTGKQLNQEEHEKAENERHLQALTAQINLAKIERQDRERHLIENIITGSQASLDKALLTISSSAIALSYYFVRDGFDPSTGWMLITSWVGWCVTIAASIVAIITSIQANARHSQAIADAGFFVPSQKYRLLFSLFRYDISKECTRKVTSRNGSRKTEKTVAGSQNNAESVFTRSMAGCHHVGLFLQSHGHALRN